MHLLSYNLTERESNTSMPPLLCRSSEQISSPHRMREYNMKVNILGKQNYTY
jgi:hypothetical protein